MPVIHSPKARTASTSNETAAKKKNADAAKKVQQYADCLKLAVDNPNIVCNQ